MSDEKDNTQPEIKTTPDGFGKEHSDVDVNAWKEEFKFRPEEIAERGPTVGFMRFVAFEKDGNLLMMSDIHESDEFAQAFIGTLVKNDETFDYLKQLVDRADRLRKIKDMDFGDIMGEIFGSRFGSPFSPGGRSFGKMDELRELLDILKRRKNPLRELAEFIEGRKSRSGPGIEVHVLGIGGRKDSDEPGSNLSELLDALRKGGPAVMAALARKMSGGDKSETATADRREDDPERNGAE